MTPFKTLRRRWCAVGLAVCGTTAAWPVFAQDVEDLPIEDAPVAPVPSSPIPPTPAPSIPTPATPAPTATVPVAPASGAPATNAASETVTIPRAVWEQVLRDIEELKRARNAQNGTAAPVATPAPAPTPASTGAVSSTGSRNYLLLPDISFVANTQGLFSSDKRDEGRNSVDLEGEISIQGYAYPGVKYDAFIAANPGEDEPFGLEEGYLTLLSAAKNLNVQVGRKFAAFGRTGELHPHSWLYSRQLLARQNLVSGEALAGNGVQLNYLLPTGKNLFARLQLGAFSGGEEGAGRVNSADPSDPFEGAIGNGPGAGFSRFYNARLWLGTSLGEKNELDFGVSYARGRSAIDDLTGFDPDGNELVSSANGRVRLSGVDLSFRRFTGVDSRLLLRGEYFQYKPQNLPTREASGYYGLANYRFDKFNDLGLLFEKSEFPTAPGAREKALSLIYTKQFAERYYVRFTGTRGDRPGENNYNEFRVQFVTGLGPHTHELE